MTGLNRKYSARKFRFVDDALPPGFLAKIVPLLPGSLPGCSWRSSLVLSGHFADREFCRRLRDSGLVRVTIGLESIVPRVLKKMNKYHQDMNTEEIKDVISSLTSAGIKVGLHIIFGFPTETAEEARRTLNFLLDNKNIYDVCWVQPFCLEEGTPVFNSPEKFGITEICGENKDAGERLGYRYKVSEGMSQDEAAEFTYREAIPELRKAGCTP